MFNGEIYNYVEIRRELEQQGATFRTESDTEVLLLALKHWGEGCINRLNGMWAFVWGDLDSGSMIVSRDRWGVKPLYVQEYEGCLLFCSEAKGIFAFTGRTPVADHASIGLFLRMGIGGENPNTWFEGVGRFPVATSQRFGIDDEHVTIGTVSRYWSYPVARTRNCLVGARSEFQATLEDAVRIRLRSDMPVGLSLSGGLDSSAIAWICSERHGRALHAFTAWHPPREQSELPRAEMIARKFGHEITPVPAKMGADVIDDLRTAIWHLESGHVSPAIVPYLNLCRTARSRLTVMLEGQGADELLAGYPYFQLFSGADCLRHGRLRSGIACVSSYLSALGWKALLQDIARFAVPFVHNKQGVRWGVARLLSATAADAEPRQTRLLNLSGSNSLDDALQHWHQGNLTNLLQYGDAVSMSVNLEARCPFLDYRLVELGFSVTDDLLVRRGFGKFLLREVCSGHLPDQICWRRQKDGFSNPTAQEVFRLVQTSGFPADGIDWAVDSGLLTPLIRKKQVIARLPENIVYRFASLAIWAELFQVGKRWK